jgi:hypothetical protein
MKKILIIFLITVNIINAQNNEFKGIVKDSETLLPIEFVNIYFENESNNNSTGSISNELGEFTLRNNESKVTFSHINYESLTITLNKKFNEIILKPKEFILDEVVISTISTRDYLNKIIEDSSNKLNKNTLLKSYCREIVKVDNKFTKFSDALVDYYVKKGNGKSKILLKESRAFDNGNIDSKDNSGIDEINSVFKLKDYVKNAYNFEMLEKIVKNENYEFERKLKRESNGKEYEFIKIIPNAESKQMLFEGFIIIDKISKNILEYRVNTSENHLENGKLINILIAKVKLKNSLKWSKFKMINNQYILTYNKKQVEMFIKIGKKVNSDFNFNSDLFVYEFISNVKIPKKGYKKKTIYQAGTNYKDEFWKKYNSFPLTESQQNFIKTANKK